METVARFRTNKGSFLLFGILVLNFVWPRSLLPSLMVTPFLMGVCTVSLFGMFFRPALSRTSGAWLAASVAAVALGPQPEPLALSALFAAALCAWIAIGLGQQFESQARLMTAMMWALIVGMIIHALASWAQFFDVERAFYPFFSWNDSHRPYGNLRQANHLATFSVVGLLALWWLFRRSALSTPALIVLAFAAFSGLSLSGSRTGLVELILLSGFLLCWRKTAIRLEFGVFVLSPIWVILLTEFSQVLTTLFGVEMDGLRGRDMASISVRFLYWQEAWSLALLHPIAGVGWGNLGWARLFELPFNSASSNTTNAHNLVLHLLAETGFATTFLFLAPVAWVLVRRPPWRMAEVNGRWAWIVIAVMGTHSFLEYPMWYMNFLIPTAFAFGVLLSACPGPPQARDALPATATTLMASLLLAASLFAVFDYMRVSRIFNDENRASSDLTRVASIQNTYLYRYYADRALVERVRLTTANAPEMLRVTDRLLREGANPIVLWVRLEALCRLGETLHAKETAALYEKVFPQSHAEFLQINSPVVLRACGLAPSTRPPAP